MPKPRHDAIPGFTPVGPAIWEYVPQFAVGVRQSQIIQFVEGPDLILLFSWTGAHGKHVAKYTAQYQRLFPSSIIMVITTSAKDLCFRNSAAKQARLQPAIDRIVEYGNISNILMHAYSEGGSNKAVEFVEAYHTSTGTRIPCSALCLDSTPGLPRYRRLVNALKLSLPPHPVLQASGGLIGGVLLGGIWVAYCGFKGFENNPISQTRHRLLDDNHWDLGAPRCYLYSEADALISSVDVEEHARETIEMGIPIVDAKFENSAHCKHTAEDSSRYWDAVLQVWIQATLRKQQLEEKRRYGMIGRWSWQSDASSERTL